MIAAPNLKWVTWTLSAICMLGHHDKMGAKLDIPDFIYYNSMEGT